MTPESAIPESCEQAHRFAIGRISDASARWRVLVEAWPEAAGYRGRLVFRADDARHPPDRESPALLHGGSAEDVVRAAYDVPEARLRTLLRSLG